MLCTPAVILCELGGDSGMETDKRCCPQTQNHYLKLILCEGRSFCWFQAFQSPLGWAHRESVAGIDRHFADRIRIYGKGYMLQVRFAIMLGCSPSCHFWCPWCANTPNCSPLRWWYWKMTCLYFPPGDTESGDDNRDVTTSMVGAHMIRTASELGIHFGWTHPFDQERIVAGAQKHQHCEPPSFAVPSCRM